MNDTPRSDAAMFESGPTAELIGAALDWAVAKCEGRSDVYYCPPLKAMAWESTDVDEETALGAAIYQYHPSTYWSQGGPIIERENIALYPHGDGTYEAEVFLNPKRGAGPTPLIAAMRCYVASKLGDEVEIPEELK